MALLEMAILMTHQIHDQSLDPCRPRKKSSLKAFGVGAAGNVRYSFYFFSHLLLDLYLIVSIMPTNPHNNNNQQNHCLNHHHNNHGQPKPFQRSDSLHEIDPRYGMEKRLAGPLWTQPSSQLEVSNAPSFASFDFLSAFLY